MIDHHVHLGKDYKLKFKLTAEDLSKKLDKYNLSRAVIFPCPNVPLKDNNPYEEANNYILKAQKIDKRFIPFMMIHPLRDNQEYFIEESKKFKGFKVYPRSQRMEYSYSSIKKSDILNFLSDSKKPIIFHTGYREGERIKDISWFAQKCKGPVIFAHSGDLIEKDLEEISRYVNVFIDVSPLATMLEKNFFISEEKRSKKLKNLNLWNVLSYLSKLFGKDKIVWGSDAPWCEQLIKDGYKKEIEVLNELEKRGLNNSFLI